MTIDRRCLPASSETRGENEAPFGRQECLPHRMLIGFDKQNSGAMPGMWNGLRPVPPPERHGGRSGLRHITGFGCQNPLAADRNVCPTGHFAAERKTRRGRGLAWATLPLKYLSQRCQPRCRSVIRQNYLAGGVVPGAFSPGFAGAAPAFLLSSFLRVGLPQPTTETFPSSKSTQ